MVIALCQTGEIQCISRVDALPTLNHLLMMLLFLLEQASKFDLSLVNFEI